MKKERILIVEDDEDILQLLSYNLEGGGFEIETAASGHDGLSKAKSGRFDLVILDLMLPGMDGFDVCREIKRDSETTDIPIIMLTARSEEVDRIVGLELGADDYVVKPFSPRELLLRVRAVLRRYSAAEAEPERSRIEHDGLVVDLDGHKAFVDGQELPLTATEFRLLAELLRSSGRVRTRDQLLTTVWGYEFEGYARTVDTHIRRLRQKLGDKSAYIETVRGVGYRFKE
jgi:two-component system phosphate regulon response regulator PhoB